MKHFLTGFLPGMLWSIFAIHSTEKNRARLYVFLAQVSRQLYRIMPNMQISLMNALLNSFRG